MGSEPDLNDQTISREGSFFSFDSGNSVYVTARELLTEDRKSMMKDKKESSLSSSIASTIDSSGTLGESSLQTDSEYQEDFGGNISPEFANDFDFELKEDVSKICNDIAEAIQPDVKKKAQISLAVASDSAASLKELRKLAISDGGLLSNILRKRSWAALLGISKNEIESLENTRIPTSGRNVTREIKNLVNMDVARVLKRFPPGLSDPQQDQLQSHLSKLIISVLDKNPDAYYYQGFHDISLTFLLVCISHGAPYLAYLCLDKMIETCMAPYMEKTMETTHDLIHVLFAIIEQEDVDLFNKIVKDCKCPAAFCLPWILTWFSHTLPNDNDVFRVYDFILGCMDQVSPSYLIPIFISASLVVRNSSKLKAIRETDIATMHHALSLLPSQQDSLEPWLRDSLKLMKSYKGKEMQLVGRAVHIKELQNQLWDADNRTNRISSSANRGGALAFLGRFIFVKHKWYTIAIVVIGTAYLIQAKYGQSIFQTSFFELIEKFIPESLRAIYRIIVENVEFQAF